MTKISNEQSVLINLIFYSETNLMSSDGEKSKLKPTLFRFEDNPITLFYSIKHKQRSILFSSFGNITTRKTNADYPYQILIKYSKITNKKINAFSSNKQVL
ncbi:hypothetical protein MHBO_005302 [Bonamia ostreae]|uniref:Uncharacterized protein n=1 Tax=Bonamia ostreae TaxID=126728 RepID=A0ABV2AJZ0_9EUKA